MTGMIVEPRVVSAGRGAGWWGDGLRLFRASMGIWIGIFFLYFILSALIGAIPFVGTIGHSLLTPVFMGGFMMGCRALEQGQPLRMSHLFEGFQGTHFVPLMIVGAIDMGLVVAIVLLTSLGLVGALGLQDLASLHDPYEAFGRSAAALTGSALLVMVIVVVLVAVIGMLNWFAPALVALRGVAPVQAMKLSFVACLRNWVPFLVYGLVVVVAGIAVTALVVGIAFVLGASALMGEGSSGGIGAFIGFIIFVFVASLLFALIVGPVAIGSVYASFKDTLDDDDATVTNPQFATFR